ncbi:MAG: hypothetical protein ABH859_04280 [Pseudomonadota bacterium]
MKKIFFAICLATFVSFSFLAQAGEYLAVIVHPSNSLRTISKGKLAAIFRGEEKYWPDGKNILLVNQSLGNSARKNFYQKVLKTSPATKYYIAGTMAPIRTVVQKSENAVMLFVSNMPQSIGYVSADLPDESVKILLIDGEKVIP